MDHGRHAAQVSGTEMPSKHKHGQPDLEIQDVLFTRVEAQRLHKHFGYAGTEKVVQAARNVDPAGIEEDLSIFHKPRDLAKAKCEICQSSEKALIRSDVAPSWPEKYLL